MTGHHINKYNVHHKFTTNRCVNSINLHSFFNIQILSMLQGAAEVSTKTKPTHQNIAYASILNLKSITQNEFTWCVTFCNVHKMRHIFLNFGLPLNSNEGLLIRRHHSNCQTRCHQIVRPFSDYICLAASLQLYHDYIAIDYSLFADEFIRVRETRSCQWGKDICQRNTSQAVYWWRFFYI